MGNRKNEPLAVFAGNQGHGDGDLPPLAPRRGSLVVAPDNSILPQVDIVCQEGMVSEKSRLLAMADLVLEKHNRARAAAIVGGDPMDHQAAAALADDRRALLGQIGSLPTE